LVDLGGNSGTIRIAKEITKLLADRNSTSSGGAGIGGEKKRSRRDEGRSGADEDGDKKQRKKREPINQPPADAVSKTTNTDHVPKDSLTGALHMEADDDDGDNDKDGLDPGLDEDTANHLLEKELDLQVSKLPSKLPLYELPEVVVVVKPADYRVDGTTKGTQHPITRQYPKQQEIGDKITKKICKQLEGLGKKVETFEAFEFCIQVPALNSLYNQTLDRVAQFGRCAMPGDGLLSTAYSA
jgi:hypothetical protein